VSELEKIREARAVIAAARAQRIGDRAEAEELEREKQLLADDEAMEKAEAAHGPPGRAILAVPTDLGVVIVKRPHAALFRRFQDSETTSMQECEKLVRPCVVHPPSAELDKILDQLPATLPRLVVAVGVLAGLRKEELAGK